jgi:DNA-binding CsgD family transcriptional regulator
MGSYEETARQLGLDRRTVKAKVDEAMLARMRG